MINFGHNLFFFSLGNIMSKSRVVLYMYALNMLYPGKLHCVLELHAAIARVILLYFWPCLPSLSVYAVIFDK